jgi:beta-barrel assembly-enhancing protease
MAIGYHSNMRASTRVSCLVCASLLVTPPFTFNAQTVNAQTVDALKVDAQKVVTPSGDTSSGSAASGNAPTVDPGRSSPAANLPRLGDAGAEELPPGTERRIGEAIMRDLRRERALLDDVELTDYLNRFAATLTETPAAQGFSFEFFLVRDTSMNAFAMPGGFIGVHTGLITASSNESELASVLAHEIGHVTQRHIARMLATQRQSSVLQLAALVLGALAARSNPQAAVGLATLGAGAQQQIMLSFSRDAEREADRVGIDMLRGAGFDPVGMVGFFSRLQQATRVYEGNAPSYLRTHPLTSERIADMQARIREERYRQRPDSLEFTLARTKLSALSDLSIDGLAAARSRFERQIKERNALDERAGMYGLALVALAQRDFATSERSIADLRKRLANGHPFLERLAVEGKLARGDASGAVQLADTALQRFPQARALNHLRAQALIDLREYDRAVAFLQDQLTLYRSDTTLWRLLAQAQGARGRAADAHRASAEEYALIGGWLAAIDQLRLAQRVGTLDFYAASQVDSRVRELQAQYTIEQQDRR